MLADGLTKTQATAKRTLELFLRNGHKWRLIFDPKFESERRRSRKRLDRLIENDVAEETGEDQLNFVEYQDGKFQNIRLEVEDGHVKFPDTPEVAQFMRRARQRIAYEDKALHMKIFICK